MNLFYGKGQISNDVTAEVQLTALIGVDKLFKDVTVNMSQCMKATVAMDNLL